MSYAKNEQSDAKAAPFNHFVVFDELNVLACHDFEVRQNQLLKTKNPFFWRDLPIYLQFPLALKDHIQER